MVIVTITSDWKKEDYYLGTLKGLLFSLPYDLRIVDITNSVPSFDVLREIFILRSTFQKFPKGSVHLMGVMSEPSVTSQMVIVCAEGHYFVGINDGRFSLLLNNLPSVCFEIIYKSDSGHSTFMAPYLFAEAVDIIVSEKFESRTKIAEVVSEPQVGVVFDDNTIVGRIIYSDSLGNAITNISKTLFDSIHKGRDYTIFVQGPYLKINLISAGYNESAPGEAIALFNSVGLLELAVIMGDITSTENLSPTSEVRIKFY